MKINRWIALAAIVLLVAAAMGFVSFRVLAGPNHSDAALDCAPETEDNAADDANEVEAADTEECDGAGDTNELNEANGQDQSDEAAPAGTGITADRAQAIAEAANPGAGALGVEFDREAGREIWEVELDNGLDVQIDANSGVILNTKNRDE